MKGDSTAFSWRTNGDKDGVIPINCDGDLDDYVGAENGVLTGLKPQEKQQSCKVTVANKGESKICQSTITVKPMFGLTVARGVEPEGAPLNIKVSIQESKKETGSLKTRNNIIAFFAKFMKAAILSKELDFDESEICYLPEETSTCSYSIRSSYQVILDSQEEPVTWSDPPCAGVEDPCTFEMPRSDTIVIVTGGAEEEKKAGICGSANGQTYSVQPSIGLCDYTTESPVTVIADSIGWKWNCYGDNNSSSDDDVSCNAIKRLLPPDLSGSAGVCGGNIDLSWNAVSGAASYVLNRNGLDISKITGTSYADSGLAYGSSYDYKIKSCNANDVCFDYSPVISATSSAQCVLPVPPTVSISCDPVSCNGYKNAVADDDGALKLSYSAIDNDNDLNPSTCSFKIDGSQKSSFCAGFYWPTVDVGVTNGNHSSLMYAADMTDLSSTVSRAFTILRDIEADFNCSLDGSTFKLCSSIVAPRNDSVYFKDMSTASSGGASLGSWSWSFTNGNPSSSSQRNPSAKFTAEGYNNVTLTVTDTADRRKSITRQVRVGESLKPLWKEVIPR